MKNLFLRFCRWALPLLGVSATVSCDFVIQTPDMYGCPPAPEYGVPVMEFRISGKVEDAVTGEPVKGIAVTRIYRDDQYEPRDTAWTADDGQFLVQGSAFPADRMTLKFTDVDGEENGEYATESLEVGLERIEDPQDVWHEGVYAAEDINVRLDPVRSSETAE